MSTEILRHGRAGLLAAVVSCVACSGCTSVIMSGSLRDAWLDAADRPMSEDADEDGPPAAADASSETRQRPGAARGASTDAGGDAVEPPVAPLSLADALAVADAQLASTGGLVGEARQTLATMLEATPAQDWPVVVEEFATALAASRKTAAAEGRLAAPAAPAGDPVASTAAAGTVVSAAAEPPSVTAAAPTATEPPAAAAPPADAPAAVDGPELAVANACFASRVRAWGVVDRFATDRFAAGQQVILYYELDRVTAEESAAGHTTRVDTRLALRGHDGGVLHEWSFDPLEETCLSRRRDYFARYVLSLPESLAPGPCRLEVTIEDLCSGRTVATSLPLEIVRAR